jgi:hypothetical protein
MTIGTAHATTVARLYSSVIQMATAPSTFRANGNRYSEAMHPPER